MRIVFQQRPSDFAVLALADVRIDRNDRGKPVHGEECAVDRALQARPDRGHLLGHAKPSLLAQAIALDRIGPDRDQAAGQGRKQSGENWIG